MKSFIITMKGHELSETLSQECQQQAAQHGLDVQIFEAIWGQDYQQHLQTLGIRLSSQQKPGKMTLGHYGNFLSHYYLWQGCVRDNVPYLVLEHDGWILRDIPSNLLDQFDDVCKLDCYSPYMTGYSSVVVKDLASPVTAVPIQQLHEATGHGDAIRVKTRTDYYSCGVYAYIIKPQGAKKLIDHVQANGFLATDNQVNSRVMTVVACVPPVARLHPIMKSSKIMAELSTSKQSPNPHTGEGMQYAEQQ
jgi:GR25 family glycosyltransferase involved in LPS biosynthesis